METEVNQLIRQVAQVCMNCKHGRAQMKCTHRQCHNRKVRGWLKQIDEINKEAITK